MAYETSVQALMDILVDALPMPVRRRIAPSHVRLLAQFTQFGLVGVAGFAVDTAVVYAVRWPLGLYLAGAVAYAVAVTATWWLNRVWTFRSLGQSGPAHRQWVRFTLASLPGLCLNLGTYFLLVASFDLCAAEPVIAIAAGAVAGMFANFTLSRAVVFR